MDSDFYRLPTLQLAQFLIGKKLVHHTLQGLFEGYIVETEAYMGPNDRAAHSYNGRRTARTEVMFGEAGTIYTYTMHTHVLLNIVAGPIETPHAILIRAVEPLPHCMEQCYRNRPKAKQDKQLTNGPGKLCQAFAITMDLNGQSILKGPLSIEMGREAGAVRASERIGIENSGEAKHYLWRFYEEGNPYVSRL